MPPSTLARLGLLALFSLPCITAPTRLSDPVLKKISLCNDPDVSWDVKADASCPICLDTSGIPLSVFGEHCVVQAPAAFHDTVQQRSFEPASESRRRALKNEFGTAAGDLGGGLATMNYQMASLDDRDTDDTIHQCDFEIASQSGRNSPRNIFDGINKDSSGVLATAHYEKASLEDRDTDGPSRELPLQDGSKSNEDLSASDLVIGATDPRPQAQVHPLNIEVFRINHEARDSVIPEDFAYTPRPGESGLPQLSNKPRPFQPRTPSLPYVDPLVIPRPVLGPSPVLTIDSNPNLDRNAGPGLAFGPGPVKIPLDEPETNSSPRDVENDSKLAQEKREINAIPGAVESLEHPAGSGFVKTLPIITADEDQSYKETDLDDHRYRQLRHGANIMGPGPVRLLPTPSVRVAQRGVLKPSPAHQPEPNPVILPGELKIAETLTPAGDIYRRAMVAPAPPLYPPPSFDLHQADPNKEQINSPLPDRAFAYHALLAETHAPASGLFQRQNSAPRKVDREAQPVATVVPRGNLSPQDRTGASYHNNYYNSPDGTSDLKLDDDWPTGRVEIHEPEDAIYRPEHPAYVPTTAEQFNTQVKRLTPIPGPSEIDILEQDLLQDQSAAAAKNPSINGEIILKKAPIVFRRGRRSPPPKEVDLTECNVDAGVPASVRRGYGYFAVTKRPSSGTKRNTVDEDLDTDAPANVPQSLLPRSGNLAITDRPKDKTGSNTVDTHRHEDVIFRRDGSPRLKTPDTKEGPLSSDGVWPNDPNTDLDHASSSNPNVVEANVVTLYPYPEIHRREAQKSEIASDDGDLLMDRLPHMGHGPVVLPGLYEGNPRILPRVARGTIDVIGHNRPKPVGVKPGTGKLIFDEKREARLVPSPELIQNLRWPFGSPKPTALDDSALTARAPSSDLLGAKSAFLDVNRVGLARREDPNSLSAIVASMISKAFSKPVDPCSSLQAEVHAQDETVYENGCRSNGRRDVEDLTERGIPSIELTSHDNDLIKIPNEDPLQYEPGTNPLQRDLHRQLDAIDGVPAFSLSQSSDVGRRDPQSTNTVDDEDKLFDRTYPKVWPPRIRPFSVGPVVKDFSDDSATAETFRLRSRDSVRVERQKENKRGKSKSKHLESNDPKIDGPFLPAWTFSTAPIVNRRGSDKQTRHRNEEPGEFKQGRLNMEAGERQTGLEVDQLDSSKKRNDVLLLDLDDEYPREFEQLPRPIEAIRRRSTHQNSNEASVQKRSESRLWRYAGRDGQLSPDTTDQYVSSQATQLPDSITPLTPKQIYEQQGMTTEQTQRCYSDNGVPVVYKHIETPAVVLENEVAVFFPNIPKEKLELTITTRGVNVIMECESGVMDLAHRTICYARHGVIGTHFLPPPFLSPVQAQGTQQAKRSDLFAINRQIQIQSQSNCISPGASATDINECSMELSHLVGRRSSCEQDGMTAEQTATCYKIIYEIEYDLLHVNKGSSLPAEEQHNEMSVFVAKPVMLRTTTDNQILPRYFDDNATVRRQRSIIGTIDESNNQPAHDKVQSSIIGDLSNIYQDAEGKWHQILWPIAMENAHAVTKRDSQRQPAQMLDPVIPFDNKEAVRRQSSIVGTIRTGLTNLVTVVQGEPSAQGDVVKPQGGVKGVLSTYMAPTSAVSKRHKLEKSGQIPDESIEKSQDTRDTSKVLSGQRQLEFAKSRPAEVLYTESRMHKRDIEKDFTDELVGPASRLSASNSAFQKTGVHPRHNVRTEDLWIPNTHSAHGSLSKADKAGGFSTPKSPFIISASSELYARRAARQDLHESPKARGFLDDLEDTVSYGIPGVPLSHAPMSELSRRSSDERSILPREERINDGELFSRGSYIPPGVAEVLGQASAVEFSPRVGGRRETKVTEYYKPNPMLDGIEELSQYREGTPFAHGPTDIVSGVGKEKRDEEDELQEDREEREGHPLVQLMPNVHEVLTAVSNGEGEHAVSKRNVDGDIVTPLKPGDAAEEKEKAPWRPLAHIFRKSVDRVSEKPTPRNNKTKKPPTGHVALELPWVSPFSHSSSDFVGRRTRRASIDDATTKPWWYWAEDQDHSDEHHTIPGAHSPQSSVHNTDTKRAPLNDVEKRSWKPYKWIGPTMETPDMHETEMEVSGHESVRRDIHANDNAPWKPDTIIVPNRQTPDVHWMTTAVTGIGRLGTSRQRTRHFPRKDPEDTKKKDSKKERKSHEDGTWLWAEAHRPEKAVDKDALRPRSPRHDKFDHLKELLEKDHGRPFKPGTTADLLYSAPAVARRDDSNVPRGLPNPGSSIEGHAVDKLSLTLEAFGWAVGGKKEKKMVGRKEKQADEDDHEEKEDKKKPKSSGLMKLSSGEEKGEIATNGGEELPAMSIQTLPHESYSAESHVMEADVHIVTGTKRGEDENEKEDKTMKKLEALEKKIASNTEMKEYTNAIGGEKLTAVSFQLPLYPANTADTQFMESEVRKVENRNAGAKRSENENQEKEKKAKKRDEVEEGDTYRSSEREQGQNAWLHDLHTLEVDTTADFHHLMSAVLPPGDRNKVDMPAGPMKRKVEDEDKRKDKKKDEKHKVGDTEQKADSDANGESDDWQPDRLIALADVHYMMQAVRLRVDENGHVVPADNRVKRKHDEEEQKKRREY